MKAGLTHFPDEVEVINDEGLVARGVNWNLTPDEWEQVREGVRCLNCMEDLRPSGAFPDECPVCKFAVKESQTYELSRQHQGTIDTTVPSPNMRAVMEEREREDWVKRTGIWLPGSPS